MNFLNRNHDRVDPYATSDDFRRVFAEYAEDLQMFSLLLTANHEAAERCFVAGLEESVQAIGVFREWAHSWAKRTIIQNAIHALHPRPPAEDVASFALVLCDIGKPAENCKGLVGIRSVLALSDFDRIVFVMSVLEGYTEKRCSLLLDCTLPEIRKARARAVEQLIHSTGTVAIRTASA